MAIGRKRESLSISDVVDLTKRQVGVTPRTTVGLKADSGAINADLLAVLPEVAFAPKERPTKIPVLPIPTPGDRRPKGAADDGSICRQIDPDTGQTQILAFHNLHELAFAVDLLEGQHGGGKGKAGNQPSQCHSFQHAPHGNSNIATITDTQHRTKWFQIC